MNGQKQTDFAKLEKQVMANVDLISRPLYEFFDGVKSKTLPWHLCFAAGICIQIAILIHLDRFCFGKLGAEWLYPKSKEVFRVYYLFSILLPFGSWAIYKAVLKQRFRSKLTTTFQQIGLRNGMGKLPNFVFDKPLDSQTRKLRLARVGISPVEFDRKKDELASALHVYVDEVRENRSQGTIDFVYGREPMPKEFIPGTYTAIGSNKFLVGITRSKKFVADLRDTPHLLVAGQTGGGKSTFLRQFITSLFLNNDSHEFFLIDLKGGLEFQLFEKLDRVKVFGNVEHSAYMLGGMAKEIQTRMALLKERQCKDIEQYLAKVKEEGGSAKLIRKIIVVDEAAELFLAGGQASSGDVQSARRILSQIARQGRSLGIHLVIATQRPDSRALDPQIKANLPGVLCFQMVNDVSSISVLGTGRATDLPPIPGRGIWKNSLDFVEVQTPYMTVSEAEALLRTHYKSEESQAPETETKPTEPMAPVNHVGQQALKKGIQKVEG
jgi:hypothetical protein